MGVPAVEVMCTLFDLKCRRQAFRFNLSLVNSEKE
jgi:hypothetical protein